MANKKIEAVREILANRISRAFSKTTWPYQDFVAEDRLSVEVAGDPEIDIENWSSDEIADHVFDKIHASFGRSQLVQSAF